MMTPTSYTDVVLRFNRISHTTDAGLNIKIPIIEKVMRVPNMLQSLDFTLSVPTRENALIGIAVALQLYIRPEDSARALVSMSDPTGQIKSFAENVLRTCAPKYTLTEFYAQRNEIGNIVESEIGASLREYGYTLVRTQILNIWPSQEVENAMNSVIASMRELEAAMNRAEAAKILIVKEAEADAERRVLVGRGIAGQRIEIMRSFSENVEELVTKFGLPPVDALRYMMGVQEQDVRSSLAKSTNTKTVFYDTRQDMQFMHQNEIN